MSEKRSIRLKESTPHTDVWRTPSKAYLEGTDGTLGEGPWHCRIDEHGFLRTGNETSPEYPGIVFLGGSFVESMFNPEDQRFISQLERRLNSDGINVRCLNGGYSGSTTLQLLNVLLNKVVPLVGRGGTVVFFVPVGSDLSIYFRPHSYWYPTDRYAPLLPPFTPEAADLPRGGSGLASLLRLVAAAASEFGLNLIFVSSPHREGSRSTDAHLARMLTDSQLASVQHRIAEVQTAIVQVAAETGVPLLDAATAFLDKPHAFYDEWHLNDSGQELFASWMYESLAPLLAGLGVGAEPNSASMSRAG